MRPLAPPVIVCGMVAGDPHQGGASWAVLQYVLGLRRLGHDVYLIEPQNLLSLRPAGVAFQSSENAAYFRDVVRSFGLEDRASLLLDGTDETVGLPIEALREVSKRAALLLNISGMLQREDLIGDIPIRVYLDLDPAFNQLWHATQGIDMRLAAHNRFVTVGKALGQAACTVPTCGVEWITTFQPVMLEYCAASGPVRHAGLTTVANWRGYGSIRHDGVHYGQKAHSLRAFMDLPGRTREEFILALSIHPGESGDLTALRQNGWRMVDPRCVAATPPQYLSFIGGSKAEFGIAKSGYVASRCGWFSDRSACYLAFGRPVVAQETGFSDYLPCGAGLFSFRTAEDVLAAIEEINADYPRHSRAASEIAREYFESGKVLSTLTAAVGLSS